MAMAAVHAMSIKLTAIKGLMDAALAVPVVLPLPEIPGAVVMVPLARGCKAGCSIPVSRFFVVPEWAVPAA